MAYPCLSFIQLGDYHIGRSCRLQSSVEAERAAKAAAEEEEETAFFVVVRARVDQVREGGGGAMG